MALSAEDIAASLRPVVEELDVPDLGGTVRIKPQWGADAEYIRYVYGDGLTDPQRIAQSINALRLGDNEAAAADKRVELWERYIAKNNPPPQRELEIRQMIGTLVVCVVDDDDKPIWTWDDIGTIRGLMEGGLGEALMQVAAQAWILAAPETLEEAGKDSEPTPSS